MKRLRFLVSVIMTAVVAALPLPQAASADTRPVVVGLSNYQDVSSVKIDSNAIIVYQDMSAPPVYTLESGSGFTLSPSESGIAVSREGEPLCVLENPYIQGVGGLTGVGGISYRGFIRAMLTQSGIALVNVLDAEQYLLGVVPTEMSPSWHMEALMAQAVASRTYLFSQLGLNRHGQDVYEICDTTHCQAYSGTSREHERSNEAVSSTAGIMAYYDGSLIEAVFSASSGGHTENAENVWGAPYPYLKGVKEVAENEFLEWSKTFTLAQLSAGLAANGDSVGSVVSVTAEYVPSGRVGRLTVNGTNGSKTYEGDAIRGLTRNVDGSLPSIMFKINGFGWSHGGVWDGGYSASAASLSVLGATEAAVVDIPNIYITTDTGTAVKYGGQTIRALSGGGEALSYQTAQNASAVSGENTFTITSDTISLVGRGNGHGVGMSQYGAKGMAEAGYDYRSILKHYYYGIEIK